MEQSSGFPYVYHVVLRRLVSDFISFVLFPSPPVPLLPQRLDEKIALWKIWTDMTDIKARDEAKRKPEKKRKRISRHRWIFHGGNLKIFKTLNLRPSTWMNGTLGNLPCLSTNSPPGPGQVMLRNWFSVLRPSRLPKPHNFRSILNTLQRDEKKKKSLSESNSAGGVKQIEWKSWAGGRLTAAQQLCYFISIC